MLSTTFQRLAESSQKEKQSFTKRSCSFLKKLKEAWDTAERDPLPSATKPTSYLNMSEQAEKASSAQVHSEVLKQES